jgi:hypothetical protein
VVLWNTRYLDAALTKIRATEMAVKPEDVQRLSPLLLDHINVLGRYEFALKESIRQGGVTPRNGRNRTLRAGRGMAKNPSNASHSKLSVFSGLLRHFEIWRKTRFPPC